MMAMLATSGHGSAFDRDLEGASDFRIRAAAALRLGQSGGREARGDLERGLRDPHPAGRHACAVALVQLFGYTDNEHEASSILRSLENMAGDPTITRFEITPEPNPYRNVYPGAATAVWKVTPIR